MLRFKETIRFLWDVMRGRKLDDVATISRISLPLALSSLNLTIGLKGMRPHRRINKEKEKGRKKFNK